MRLRKCWTLFLNFGFQKPIIQICSNSLAGSSPIRGCESLCTMGLRARRKSRGIGGSPESWHRRPACGIGQASRLHHENTLLQRAARAVRVPMYQSGPAFSRRIFGSYRNGLHCTNALKQTTRDRVASQNGTCSVFISPIFCSRIHNRLSLRPYPENGTSSVLRSLRGSGQGGGVRVCLPADGPQRAQRGHSLRRLSSGKLNWRPPKRSKL